MLMHYYGGGIGHLQNTHPTADVENPNEVQEDKDDATSNTEGQELGKNQNLEDKDEAGYSGRNSDKASHDLDKEDGYASM